jgi:hypothetical protein
MKTAIAVIAAWAFSFLPPLPCGQTPYHEQCRVARPKDWTVEERRHISDALDRLSAHELARGILAGARDNGYEGFQRYSTDTRRNESGEQVAKFSPGFVLFDAKTIGITDAFFEMADVRDPIAAYRLGDFVLLHELIHAFDDRQHSTAAGFTAATGWLQQNGRWAYTNRVSVSDYNGIFAETLTLYARGRYLDAWTRDRGFATTLAVPLPRIQSLATPAEAFADILAHLILDSTARSYLKPSVVAWFESDVFPALRARAMPRTEVAGRPAAQAKPGS